MQHPPECRHTILKEFCDKPMKIRKNHFRTVSYSLTSEKKKTVVHWVFFPNEHVTFSVGFQFKTLRASQIMVYTFTFDIHVS